MNTESGRQFRDITASDSDAFLDTQQDLLLDIMEIINPAGAVIALPSQTLHLAGTRSGVTESA